MTQHNNQSKWPTNATNNIIIPRKETKIVRKIETVGFDMAPTSYHPHARRKM
jgi:hypothetical protein